MKLCALFPVLLLLATHAASPQALTNPADTALHDLCNKDVALLGESPVHGFGKTLEFKATLVRRLVDDCHYNAVFFESGIYDFLHIQNQLPSGHAIGKEEISAAIGGLWSNQETHALIPFLREKMQAGALTLGGLDDQIGRNSWASHDMSSDLVQPLPAHDRQRCLTILQRHMLWQYTGTDPYSPADKEKILTCLNDIEAHLPQKTKTSANTHRVMVKSLQRNLARNFTEDDFSKPGQSTQWMNDRDHSMYLNFQWLLARLPPHSKVIVWAATVHTAKDLTGIQGMEGRTPLGSYLHHDFGDRAFSLGFSALSGTWAAFGKTPHPLSTAPADSLEAQAFANQTADTLYLSRPQLQTLGHVPARPLGTTFDIAPWATVLDGLILFREERPPTSVPF